MPRQQADDGGHLVLRVVCHEYRSYDALRGAVVDVVLVKNLHDHRILGAVAIAARHGVNIQFDEQAQAPYIYNAAERKFLSFDDERSIRAKKAYAQKMGLAGMMFWEYANDGAESQLLNAMV